MALPGHYMPPDNRFLPGNLFVDKFLEGNMGVDGRAAAVSFNVHGSGATTTTSCAASTKMGLGAASSSPCLGNGCAITPAITGQQPALQASMARATSTSNGGSDDEWEALAARANFPRSGLASGKGHRYPTAASDATTFTMMRDGSNMWSHAMAGPLAQTDAVGRIAGLVETSATPVIPPTTPSRQERLHACFLEHDSPSPPKQAEVGHAPLAWTAVDCAGKPCATQAWPSPNNVSRSDLATAVGPATLVGPWMVSGCGTAMGGQSTMQQQQQKHEHLRRPLGVGVGMQLCTSHRANIAESVHAGQWTAGVHLSAASGQHHAVQQPGTLAATAAAPLAPSPGWGPPANNANCHDLQTGQTPLHDRAGVAEEVHLLIPKVDVQLAIEVAGPLGFFLAAAEADVRVPHDLAKVVSAWPGAVQHGPGRWRFPPQKYRKVRRLLRMSGQNVQRAMPPPWVLAAVPQFRGYGSVRIPKKVAYVLQADAAPPGPLIASDIRSRDGSLALLPYQREGVEFGMRRGGRAMLADEMGLGKTAQALVLAAQYPRDWPLLVICPSSLRATWRDEAERWVPKEIMAAPWEEVHVVRKGNDQIRDGTRMVIVSYDLAAQNPRLFTRPRSSSSNSTSTSSDIFRLVICDEAHYLKSPGSQRSRTICPMLRRARRCLLISGTPALGRAAELFSPLDTLLPGLLPSHETFLRRYCEPKVFKAGRRQVTQWMGCRKGLELKALLESTVMIRRAKDDVLTQLPDKRRQRIILDKLSPAELKEIQGKLKDYGTKHGAGAHGASAVEQVLQASSDGNEDASSFALELFGLTGRAKIPAVQEYVEYLVQAGCRFLLFAHHLPVMDGLQETLEAQRIRYIRIDGSTPSRRREVLVESFHTDAAIQVALLSTTVCGVGLNLQCCSTVVFAELHWTPGVLLQAEDRCHRMGQRRCVNVHYLIAKGTLDESMYRMLERKHSDVSVMLNGATATLGARQAHGQVGDFTTTAGLQVEHAAASSSAPRGRKRPAENVR